MFGFGKKKKAIKSIIASVEAAMGTYMIMRSLSKGRMKETGLGELPLMLFEASHILGIVDCLAHAQDPDEKYATPEDILMTAESFCVSYEIFSEKDAEGVFQGVTTMMSSGNPVHKTMYTGAIAAQDFLSAIYENDDDDRSTGMARAMGLNFLDDEELVKDFKEYLNESGIKS